MKTKTLLALAATLLLAASARADDAQEHVTKGMRYYNIQDWPNALKELKEAYTIEPKPETLWAIAQTQRLSGDCRTAMLTYKAFMRTASPAGANAAEEFIKKCETDLAEQQRALQTEPPKTATPTPPPTTTATTNPPAPAPPPPPEEPKKPGPWILDPLGDVLFVVALGGLGTGGVMLALGNVDMSAAATKSTSAAYDKSVSNARVEQTVGVVASSAGAAFLGLAIWRFVAVASSRKLESAKTSFVVAPTVGGAVASYAVRF